MKLFALFPAAMVASLMVASPAHPQEREPATSEQTDQSAIQMRAEQVVDVINGTLDPKDVFTDGFLGAVPPEQLAALSQQITQQFGAAVSVESVDPSDGTRSALAIRMERAIARGGIAINPADDNRVSELLFQNFEPIGDTIAKIENDLAALPGSVSVYFGPLDGSDPRLAIEPDKQMAIGSTFKLYVLSALTREIMTDDDKHWTDIAFLGEDGTCLLPPCEPTFRSFPSGMTQDWPAPTPMTLQTLATLMISISDNTATDALIRHLSEERVVLEMEESGHSAPELNQPFLTTRQMFALKSADPGIIENYRAASLEEKYDIAFDQEMREIAEEDVQAAFSNGPNALDIEWFASAHDLRRLLAAFPKDDWNTARRIMAVNTSTTPTARENWRYVGYKGGSEPGVLNLTWLLTDLAGREHALVLSWNNPEADLDETAMELIAQRILSLPAQ